VTTKVNHQGGSSDDRETDAFLDEEYKKKVSDEIRQRKREKKLQGEFIVQESSPAINTSCITDLSTTSTELVTLPERVVEESIPKESAMSCELKLSSGNKQDTSSLSRTYTTPKKIPYNLKVEQDLRDELSAYMEGKGSASQSGEMFTSVNPDKIFDIQIPEFSLEAILMGSNKVTSQIIVDLFNIAMKTRRKEILYWYCYYKAYEDRVRDVKSKNGIDDKSARTLVYSEIKPLLPDITDVNLRKITFRAKKIYILFDGIGINRIQIISCSASAISNLSDNQIQDIINDFPKNATNMDEKHLVGETVPNWNRHVISKINKTDALEIQVNPLGMANVPFISQSKPTYDRSYFRNKILDRYPNLFREGSSENFDYYGITDETSCGDYICPLCKLSHDDEEIEGRYKAGSYFIKCEQREIEIVA
jgi:hypothetical protein